MHCRIAAATKRSMTKRSDCIDNEVSERRGTMRRIAHGRCIRRWPGVGLVLAGAFAVLPAEALGQYVPAAAPVAPASSPRAAPLSASGSGPTVLAPVVIVGTTPL